MDHQIEAERIFREYMGTPDSQRTIDEAERTYPASDDEEDIEWQIELVHMVLDRIEANHRSEIGDEDWSEIEPILIGMLIDVVG